MRKSLSFALSLVGLFDSLYLLWVYTSPSRPMVCLGTGCDAVRASAYSSFLGRPIPVYGVAAYLTLAILMFGEPLLSGSFSRVARYAMLTITGPGFLFTLYLTYLEAFVLHAWCAWCVVSALTMTCLFAFTLLGVARTGLEEPALQLAQARRNFAIFLAAVFVGIPSFYMLARQSEIPTAPPPPAQALAEHLVRADSHVFGNPKAPVTVVEFGDFKCPACSRAEEAAREIRAKDAGRIRFVFRQFPLSLIHPESEKAAEASECAAQQGKFWEAVDSIYAHHEDLSVPALKRLAPDVGLDQRRFDQCLDSGVMAARVRQDTQDGEALGVRATPTFFIGRVKVEGAPTVAQFSRLIDNELTARGTPTAAISSSPVDAGPAPAPQMAKANAPTEKTQNSPAKKELGTSPSGPLGAGSGGSLFAAFQDSSTACSEAEAAKQQPVMITTAQLRQLLDHNSQPLFVDVRPARDFSASRIPGAINVPVDDMEQKWSTLPRNRTIILYESGQASGDVCAASRAAGRILLSHGFPAENVKVYQDGLAGWEKGGMQIIH